MKIGTTTIPLAGWGVDPRRPERGRERRLAAICQIVEGHRYRVSICPDVGHQAYESGDPLAFLAQHGERIREVHLHDFVHVSAGGRAQTRDHLPPFPTSPSRERVMAMSGALCPLWVIVL